jgi:hypothetical protein
MSKQIHAHVNVDWDTGYCIRWLSESDFGDYEPVIEEINFYDEASQDDIVIPIIDSDLTFSLEENDDTISIGFSGTLELSMSKEDYDKLEAQGFSVDYLMVFNDSDGDQAESDEDYELIENYNIVLEVAE